MKISSIKVGPYINFLPLQYIPEHKISYVEFGDPKNTNIIICVHSLTSNAHDFDKISKELSKDYRVISLSYPGRGDSKNFKKPAIITIILIL